jgi:hypothetical protein
LKEKNQYIIKDTKFNFTDDVDCPWLDVEVLLVLGGNRPPDKLAKKFIGDEAFCVFDTIVDGDLLKQKTNEIYRSFFERIKYKR